VEEREGNVGVLLEAEGNVSSALSECLGFSSSCNGDVAQAASLKDIVCVPVLMCCSGRRCHIHSFASRLP